MVLGRLPIKLRVTIAFSAAMALVLVALGAFLYLNLRGQITDTIDAGLEARADELAARSSQFLPDLGQGSGSVIEGDESFAQVLGPDGRVLASTGGLGTQTAVEAETLDQALREPTFVEIPPLPGLEGSFRALALPLDGLEEPAVGVVGASLDDRDEALSSLLTLLFVGGPISLLLASLVGYAAIQAALRPVEAMRARADDITANESVGRLPAGSADDELSRLAATLNAMLGRLHAGLERERRFVDDASHELRTPLALHKTALELALRYETDDPGLRAAVASSVEEVDRLIQLAEDLLVVARSEEGRLAISPERVDAHALLGSAALRFQARAAESDRSIEVDSSPELAVEVDPLRIEQALTNMVDNALRHGGGTIRLRAEPVEGAVRLSVTDQGTGFPPEFLEHAFERFSRADAARTSGGSGLGLAIVATIAEAHGGRSGASNGPDGTAVWIELPAR